MSKQPNSSQLLEAILFISTSPQSIQSLATKLEIDQQAVQGAISDLRQSLKNRGLVIVESASGYELAVAPSLREAIARHTNEVAPSLSRSSLEVFTIIAYQGPCAKNIIDEIRGTPSDNSLRALLSRDLIIALAKSSNRETIEYELTSFAWRSLGVTGRNQLPPRPTKKRTDATQ